MIGYRSFLALLLLAGLFVLALPARAQDETDLVAILTLDPQTGPIAVGERATVEAHLVNQEDRPVPNKVLILYVNGEQVRRIRTDELGNASIRVSRELPVGEHHIEVVFPGTEAYDGASASQTLIVRPLKLTVETVPRIPNVTFSLEGEAFVTGADGLGVIEIDKPGTYHLEAIDVHDVQVNDDTRVSFSRWADSIFQPEREVDANGDVYLQAGFTASHRVSMSFKDLSGEEVDPARISSITLKRSNGSYFTFEDGQPRWLMSTRVMRRREGLEATPLLYSVESVVLDGTSAVNRYQQRFTVEPEDNWEIELLLYTMRIHAIDAIFGFRIGDGVELHYPDGRVEQLQFGEDREVYQSSLARGLYHVKVSGVAGMAPLTPVALSQDQEVELKVLTALDIGAGIAAGLTVALGLLFLKRPRILAPLVTPLRRRRKLVPQAGGITDDAQPAPEPSLSQEPSQDGGAGSMPRLWFAAWRRRIGMSVRGAFRLRRNRTMDVKRLRVVLVLLLGATWAAGPTAAVSQTSPIPVFAYYYIWFDTTSWDRAKTDFPLLGRYSSDDRAIMEEHVRAAHAAGIDGFIVSWKSSLKLDRRLEQLMEIAAEEDFALWIIYQGLDFDRQPLPVDRILNDLEYFSETYGDHPAFGLYDLPVVILSGTWEFTAQEIGTISSHLRGKLYLLGSERNVEGYLRIADKVDGNAYYWSSVDPTTFPGYVEKLSAMSAAVHDHRGIWVAPAAPGFDARLIGGTRVVDRRGGQTLREELNAALQSNPDAIGIISWNEFSENTHIEPSENYGTMALDVLMGRQTSQPPRVTNFDSSAQGESDAGPVFQPFILLGVFMLAAVSISVVITRQHSS